MCCREDITGIAARVGWRRVQDYDSPLLARRGIETMVHSWGEPADPRWIVWTMAMASKPIFKRGDGSGGGEVKIDQIGRHACDCAQMNDLMDVVNVVVD